MLTGESEAKLSILIRAHRIQMMFLRYQVGVVCSTGQLFYINVETKRFRQKYIIFVAWGFVISKLSILICADDTYLCELLGRWIYEIYVILSHNLFGSGLIFHFEFVDHPLIEMIFDMADVRCFTCLTITFERTWFCLQLIFRPLDLMLWSWLWIFGHITLTLWTMWSAGLLIQLFPDAHVPIVILAFNIVNFIVI